MVKKLVKSYNGDLQDQDQRYDSDINHFDEIDVKFMDLLILGKNNRDCNSNEDTSVDHTKKSQKSNL